MESPSNINDVNDDDVEERHGIIMESTTLETGAPPTTGNDESSSSSFFQKCTLLELSGSCGDFGTLLPLLVALARERKIFLAPTLLGTGIVHILTGLYWDIPIPLQPMKSIASLAIAGELSRTQVTTAGVGMGILFLGPMAYGMEWLNRWIPKSVIGGLQLGVGWKLATKGIHMIQELSWLDSMDCKVVSIVASLFCLYWLKPNRRMNENTDEAADNSQNNPFRSCCQRLAEKPPIGVYLFGVGIVMAAIKLFPNDDTSPWTITKEPFLVNALKDVTINDWKEGLLHGSLPQLPLTTLNSCLSVCMLAHTLFPEKPALSRRSVCISIGLMNLVLCPLGCLPNCHGAGGLAGQHRFGAQSGTSMIALGIFKIATSVLAHQGYLLLVLDALPISVLGVMLVLAGHELALKGVIEVVQDSTQVMICLVAALVIVGTGQTHVGALCGWITYMIYGTGYDDLLRRNTKEDNNTDDYRPVSVRPEDDDDDDNGME
jgi:hypothetical protein